MCAHTHIIDQFSLTSAPGQCVCGGVLAKARSRFAEHARERKTPTRRRVGTRARSLAHGVKCETPCGVL